MAEFSWKVGTDDSVLSPAGAAVRKPSRIPAAYLVWGTWALMLVAALAYVATFGSRVPFWDDWTLVPIVTGQRAISLSWLWEQHNEHRVPLPKLLLLGLYRLTDYDFRAGVFVNVLALAGLAALLIATARSVRGRTVAADAFIPLVLLHWGQYESLFISFTVNLVLPTVLVGVLLAIMARSREKLTWRAGVLAGVVLILLPLFGGSGVALVPVLAMWLIYAGWHSSSRAGAAGRWSGAVFIALAAAALLVVALYVQGYQRPYFCYDPAIAGWFAQVRTGVQLLATSLGPATWRFWPFSGLVIGLPAVSLLFLGLAWLGRPAERFRILGLLGFLGAVGCLLVVVGWGRSVQGPRAGFQSRFVTLAVPLLLGTYFIWDLYGPRVAGGLARAVLFGLVCLALPLNTYEGVKYALDYRQSMSSFEQDLHAGQPTYILLHRYSPFLFFSQNEELAKAMRMLRDAGAEPFPSLRADPPFQEVHLDPTTAALERMVWEGGVARGDGPDPTLVFRLPQTRFVAGIRIRYTFPDADRWPLYFQLFWANGRGFTDRDRYLNYLLERSAGEREVTVWIADRIDRFCIHPDNDRRAFVIRELVLLVPAGSPDA